MGVATSVECLAEGLWLARFPTVDLVTTEHSRHLIPPLAEASKRAPIILLAHLPADLRLVPAGMAPFWLNAFLLNGVRVKAIGITTTSRAVKVVLMGVEAALKLRANPVPAQGFPTLDELITWGHAQLKR